MTWENSQPPPATRLQATELDGNKWIVDWRGGVYLVIRVGPDWPDQNAPFRIYRKGVHGCLHIVQPSEYGKEEAFDWIERNCL